MIIKIETVRKLSRIEFFFKLHNRGHLMQVVINESRFNISHFMLPEKDHPS